jgi:ornithine cyclodeaminase
MKTFDAAATAQALAFPTLVAALRAGFQAAIQVPQRHAHAVGAAGTSLLMPAWREGDHYALKVVNIFPGNAALGLSALHAVVLLFDARTGQLLAQMDGNVITSRRTAAASALAADYLAPPGPLKLLVLGTGRVAELLPSAYAAVRPLQAVQVWGRRPEQAQALCAAWARQGIAAEVCRDLAGGLAWADAISSATLATQPLVHGAALRPGQHLDLIGGFTPAMREADGACLRRARVFIDTPEALAKAGDLLSAIDEGAFQAEAVQGTLALLCRGERAGRGGASEITLFKSVGTALEDLVAAECVWARHSTDAGH